MVLLTDNNPQSCFFFLYHVEACCEAETHQIIKHVSTVCVHLDESLCRKLGRVCLMSFTSCEAVSGYVCVVCVRDYIFHVSLYPLWLYWSLWCAGSVCSDVIGLRVLTFVHRGFYDSLCLLPVSSSFWVCKWRNFYFLTVQWSEYIVLQFWPCDPSQCRLQESSQTQSWFPDPSSVSDFYHCLPLKTFCLFLLVCTVCLLLRKPIKPWTVIFLYLKIMFPRLPGRWRGR